MKHSLWSDLISSGWPSALLAESTLISPNVPFHLAGFFVVSGRISSKTAQMIGCFFLLILFFFASSIILSFRSCVNLLNTAILLYSVYYYGPPKRPIRKYPRFWIPLVNAAFPLQRFLSHERLSVDCCSVHARLSILICRRTRMQFPLLAASGLLTDKIVPIEAYSFFCLNILDYFSR